MHIRRWGLAPVAAALAVVWAASMDPVLAQKVDKNVERAQQAETREILRIAEAAAAGTAVPSDVALAFGNDFMKAQEGKTYVPFTVSFPAEGLVQKTATMYVRLTAKTPAGAPAPAPAEDRKKDDDKNKARDLYPFESVYWLDLKVPDAQKNFRVSRPMSVEAGAYDLLVCVKEHLPFGQKEDKKKPPPPFKVGCLKQNLTVPDYWTNELATSSIILAANVEPLRAQLTPQEALEQPYTLGTTKITPMVGNKYNKADELSVVFIIYNNAQDTNRKPDVSVEYGFYQKVATEANGEKFFNKTNPQNFNATTLPAEFDPASGHQLVAGQSVPLGSFPEGEFRLEVKVTDKLSGKVITHNVPFHVGA